MGSIDFGRTFDLHGTNNDEMLRLYLRSAGLSDAIECLSPEQRRAFIYDIIKSNKEPGYWKPSTMRTSAFAVAPPSVRPPPPPAGAPLHQQHHHSRHNSGSSTYSISPEAAGVVPQRFAQPAQAQPIQVQSPPSPTRFESAKKLKGRVIEISGPIQFKHVSGDMTRDMTKNAFDLSHGAHDNVLKKYMIERGIAEEDLRGMSKQEVVKRIIQSNYTWMPRKNSSPQLPKINYATISSNNQITPPSSPGSDSQFSDDGHSMVSTRESHLQQAAPNFSRFAAMSRNFADVSEFPLPDDIQPEPEPVPEAAPAPEPAPIVHASMTSGGDAPVRRRKPAPAPPPRKPKPNSMYLPPPPPAAARASQDSLLSVYHEEMANGRETLRLKRATQQSLYQSGGFVPPPPPPLPPVASNGGGPPPPPMPPPLTSSGGGGPPPPPMPPPPPVLNSGGGPPPPPPPPMGGPPKATFEAPRKNSLPTGGGGDPRDALLESIRGGVKLKKVDQKAATISGVKPRAERKPPAMDFLTELKMGMTLRRTKNPSDNPYAAPDEQSGDESFA